MTIDLIDELSWIIVYGMIISISTFFEILNLFFTRELEYGNYDFKPCLAKSKAFFVYMVIVIIIHQVADKSVTWKQAAQATQFGAIWLQLIGQEVWQKLSYFFDQLP